MHRAACTSSAGVRILLPRESTCTSKSDPILYTNVYNIWYGMEMYIYGMEFHTFDSSHESDSSYRT